MGTHAMVLGPTQLISHYYASSGGVDGQTLQDQQLGSRPADPYTK